MLVEALIAQICAGLSGQALEACNKAFDAASIQTQLKPTIEMAEHKTTDLVVHEVEGVTGETVLVVTGTAVKVYRDKSITYPIKRNPDGVIPSIVPTLGIGNGTVNFGWRF